MKLYFLGKPSDGFGWGVANTNLVRELSKLCTVEVETTQRNKFDAPVFVPVADSSLTPLRKIKRAPRTIGYCFTEWPLREAARRNARLYDVLFAGSTWNTERLLAGGIKAHTLIQGVDFERFRPMPPTDRKGFVVFSGGKFEFRKGQDYVITAMKRFMGVHADAVLLTGWHNPWRQSIASMSQSWLVEVKNPLEGLPLDRVISLPAMPNEKTPDIYKLAHVGLFPNRCEAGTNMVMAEFMACQRAVIATAAHGHLDILNEGAYKLTTGSLDPAGWFNCNVSDILWRLEQAYDNRNELNRRAELCRKSVERFTWQACAKQIYDAAFS